MKRLAFLIPLIAGLLTSSATWANTKTVVISDTVYFNFTYTSAIDSAQLILMRGAVNDTISLMPITGSSHKICEWGPAIFNLVDSAGTYQVWIESYSSGAIIDTVLGDCLVELAARDVNVVQISGDGTAADNQELFFDDTGFDASNSKIGAVTLIANNGITSTAFTPGAIDRIANYTQYNVKGVVEDSSGNTALLFQTDLAAATNDLFNRQQLEFISGNIDGYVTQISDYVGATGVIYVMPGLPSGAPNAGDSFKVAGILIGIMANVPGSVLVNISGNNAIYADSILRPPQTMVAEDTVTTGDTLAVKKDSLIYQGGAGSGTTPAAIWNYEGIADFQDSTGNDQAGQYLFSVGLHNVSQNAPTVQMKLGTNYDGTEGSNVSDDFDTVLVKIAAIDVGAGAGIYACSLWLYDTGNSVMVSGIMVQADNSSGAKQGGNRTNVSGISVLNLNDGSYFLRIPMNSGYIQTTNPQPFTVSGATNDTIDVTWFTPSAPAGDLCAVYNYVKDANDNGIAGVRITATIPTNFWPITYEGQAIKATYTTTTNTNGLWQLPVFPSGLLLTVDGDSASFYQFTASGQLFGPMGIKVTVPDSTTFFMVPDDEQ